MDIKFNRINFVKLVHSYLLNEHAYNIEFDFVTHSNTMYHAVISMDHDTNKFETGPNDSTIKFMFHADKMQKLSFATHVAKLIENLIATE